MAAAQIWTLIGLLASALFTLLVQVRGLERRVEQGFGGKIFAFTGEDTVGVKCGRDRDEADELIARHPDEVTVMPYIGRYGWNTVRTDGAIGDDEICDLVDASYDDVVARLPKKDRPAG